MTAHPTAIKTMGIGRPCITHMNFTVTMADADKRNEAERRSHLRSARRRLSTVQADGGKRQ